MKKKKGKENKKTNKLLIAVLTLYDGESTCYTAIENNTDWCNVQEYININLDNMQSKSVKFIRRTRAWYEKLPDDVF